MFKEIASYARFAGDITLIISLVFLVQQQKQTHRMQRALMNQGVYTRATSVITFYAQSEINKLFVRMQQGETEFCVLEIQQLSEALRVTLFELQDGYLQHNAGFLDEIPFRGIKENARHALSQPVMRALWYAGCANFEPKLVDLVGSLISNTPLAKPVDLSEQFRDNLAKVREADEMQPGR